MTSYSAPQRTIGRLKRPFGELYYEVTGRGPALLFAHGLGGNHLSWWQQVAHFAPHHGLPRSENRSPRAISPMRQPMAPHWGSTPWKLDSPGTGPTPSVS